MKARVDSKEFSAAMSQAMRWTRPSTGADVSEMVMLRAVDGYLLIRTTVLDGDSVLAVNAFDVEHGDVITRASYLREFSWQTDGFLVVRHSGGKLILEYEGFAHPELSTVKEATFPSMLKIPHRVNLTKETLLRAAAHTLPMARTGLPIKSSVHIIPTETGASVVGTDGVIGYLKDVGGVEIERPISIEASVLSSALGGVGGTVKVGATEHRVEIAARDAPSRIQFSGVSSPDPSNLPDFFNLPVEGEGFVASKEAMDRVRFLASKAAAVDPAAEMLVHGSGVITGTISGQDITVPEFEICNGSTSPIVFRCDSFSRSLSILASTEEYAVSIRMVDNTAHNWFIDGDGRHFVISSAPVRFKEALQTL